MLSKKQTIKLNGVNYPMVWGKWALTMFFSLPKEDRELRGFASTAQIIWAAYEGEERNPIGTWRNILAVIIKMDDAAQISIHDAVNAILPEVEKNPSSPDDLIEKEISNTEKKSDFIESEHLPAADLA